MKLKGKIIFLTTEMAKKWKAGIWKHCYLTYYPDRKQLLGLSGDYVYVIKLTDDPTIVSYSKVPKGYRKYLKKGKTIYKFPAKLQKIIPRKLRLKNE